MSAAAPYILTLGLDETTFRRFDGERKAWFPPERNLIPAHLTLFHQLPGDARDEIVAALRAEAAGEPFGLEVAGLRPLGRGVAYEIRSPELSALRDRLAVRFRFWLTPQDRQPFRPHVTIQNKVSPEAARGLLERLSAGFAPFSARAEGLLLWRYLDGPWEPAGVFPFGASATAGA